MQISSVKYPEKKFFEMQKPELCGSFIMQNEKNEEKMTHYKPNNFLHVTHISCICMFIINVCIYIHVCKTL